MSRYGQKFLASAPACSVALLFAVAAPGTATAQVFAPYIDMTLTDSENLASVIQPASGIGTFTLAFLGAYYDATATNPGYVCEAAWGSEPIAKDKLANGSTIQKLVQQVRANGGNVILSFGGADAEELALACSSPSTLQAAYQSAITRYGATSVDFDVEGDATLGNQTSIDNRTQAILGLIAANPGLQVSYTLPVTPKGLLSNADYVLTSAASHGLNPAIINIMTMQYGTAQTTGRMLTDAETAEKNTAKQVAAAGLTSKIGITPMIGVNTPAAGSPTETFTLNDAKKLLAFVQGTPAVGRLAMWSVSRDNDSCGDTSPAQATCSGVTQSPYEFAKIFNAY